MLMRDTSKTCDEKYEIHHFGHLAGMQIRYGVKNVIAAVLRKSESCHFEIVLRFKYDLGKITRTGGTYWCIPVNIDSDYLGQNIWMLLLHPGFCFTYLFLERMLSDTLVKMHDKKVDSENFKCLVILCRTASTLND